MEPWYCKNDGCETISTYGYEKTKNLACEIHKSDDMIITFTQGQFKYIPILDATKNIEYVIL